MPVAMNLAIGERGALEALYAFLGGAPPREALEAIKGQLGLGPKAYNWLGAVFSNATTDRPADGLFRSPARCRHTFPADANLV